jgi:hypothetical protein
LGFPPFQTFAYDVPFADVFEQLSEVVVRHRTDAGEHG